VWRYNGLEKRDALALQRLLTMLETSEEQKKGKKRNAQYANRAAGKKGKKNVEGVFAPGRKEKRKEKDSHSDFLTATLAKGHSRRGYTHTLATGEKGAALPFQEGRGKKKKDLNSH